MKYFNYSKFGNDKNTVDGIEFDSKRESRRYEDLKKLERSGVISDLQLQVPFELIPSQYMVINGKRKCVERACKYIADNDDKTI